MDSPTDLFGRQSSLISPFDPYLNPSTALDLPRHLTPSGRGHGAPYPGANPSSRPPYPLIHHLLQPGGAPMRSRGQLHLDQYHKEEEGMGGGLVGVAGKRLSGALVADWSYDTTRVKRLRLESLVKGDGEIGLEEEKGRRSVQTGGREGRRREREELKEQLEEARGRLKALQEKVWKAFGQRSAQEEERRRSGREEEEDDDGDGGMDEEEEETAEGITEEDVEEEDLSLSFLPSTPPFQGIAKRDRKVRDHEKRRSEEQRNVNGGGGVFLEGVLERAAVWMGCGVMRGEFEGFGGGQKFAQALKQELGSAVARVIDRVLRLYTQNEPLPPSIRPSILSSGEGGNEGGGRVWAALREREERRERGRGGGSVTHDQPPHSNGAPPTHPHALQEQSEALPLVTRRPDNRRNPLLPPNNHPNNRTKNTLLPPHPFPPLCQPHPPHPALLPPSTCPLPLPLLHYTMQQLFTRSLSHLPPLHKGGVMNPFPPSSQHSYPPLAVMGGLDRLDGGMQHHHDRERDGGMRGGGGREGGMDSGMYLGPGSSQEGLSPCHLKKAKLMFFYARYPSSNTLKTYFPDVKFNRCVTSQLIKWFSNFREFFYIQMERFARQAAHDGLPRDGAPCLGRVSRETPLRLGRDTELYRILNMHYNKSNDYQVPDRFVEIAELALREFYTAIQTGRDSDPCWKKSIYKIICKLDSPVPDGFRLPGCPMG
ncbi:prospero homeobox protein 1 [Coregonus clupeaformis]|uniref:prospero homeobox protein 1 n=1 Tax=Coregonus clupeaformis TaxID=59861 RepID=UPI001BE0C90A|nr:prospero homeobox protein 1 [Coregonus clupeaformis]XP_041727631.1 prospero homeobox protein 1 [Coregonus clupeaformis]XP_041727632.1 prospero homeobox protein 1 [Coregonus clupeaformis]